MNVFIKKYKLFKVHNNWGDYLILHFYDGKEWQQILADHDYGTVKGPGHTAGETAQNNISLLLFYEKKNIYAYNKMTKTTLNSLL